MRLDYGAQLSPLPIKLSIGTLKKPKLRDIAEITFDKFNFFEVFLKITPKTYYEKIVENSEIWNNLSDEEKETVSIYQMILLDSRLKDIYLELFNFFIVEKVIFVDGFFVVLNEGYTGDEPLKEEMIKGAIQENTFPQIIGLMQQICCIYDKTEDEGEVKYKNDIARKIYEKILKGQKENQKRKKGDKNLSIPNIISSVSNKHPSINYINIWDLTIFQLLDAFNRLQANAIYEIDSARVSTWGDEKKTFDAALWYKNIYDNELTK